MPLWLPVVAAAVLVWWPITFALALLGSGIRLLLVSMVLALLAAPAVVVLLVRADQQANAAARRRHATGR